MIRAEEMTDDELDELHSQRHRSFLQAKLRRLPYGHPDEEEIIDALNTRKETTMNLPNRPAIAAAYETAVVAFLNACPDAEEHEAEQFVDALATLIFTTMQTYIEEAEHESAANH